MSQVSTLLETAAIIGWFAVVLAGTKRLDNAVTARRMAETGAENAATISGARCENAASIDRLGLETTSLPFVPQVGLAYPETFPAQQTPLRHAVSKKWNVRVQPEDLPDGTAENVLHGVTATRQLSCQDIPPPHPTADARIQQLRSQIWMRNLRGYL